MSFTVDFITTIILIIGGLIIFSSLVLVFTKFGLDKFSDILNLDFSNIITFFFGQLNFWNITFIMSRCIAKTPHFSVELTS